MTSRTSAQLAFFDSLRPGPPLEATPPEPQPPAPEGQLNLFGGAALHLRTITELLGNGALGEASALTAQLAPRISEAAHWHHLIEGWRHRLELCGESPADLARLADDGAALAAPGEGGGALRAALLVGLHHLIARRAELEAPGALVNGRPAGWHFLLAGRVEEARTSLAATIARGEKEGLCCVLLGNLALSEGSSGVARSWYLQGFLRDPVGVPVDRIADPAIPELLDDAAELELTPAVAWVPLVGQARGLFGPTRERSVDPKVERFQTLLQESRSGSTRVRRELKALAPALFALLRDEGKL